jgi:PKD repeat protein
LLYDGVNYTVVLEGAAPPVSEPLSVDAGADQTVAEGDVVSFTGTATGGTGTYIIAWDFGDGAADTASLEPTHVYADDGVYTVNLTVTDDETSATDTLTVTVSNVAPIVSIVGNQAVSEGDTVSFSATVTDAGSADTHTIAWDFGDGGTATGETATHVYADDDIFEYTVTVTVTDDDGASTTDTLTVTITEVIEITDFGPYTFAPGFTLFALPPCESFYDENDELITMDAQTLREKTGASTIYGFDKSDPENPQWIELASDYVLEVGTGYFILREANDPIECSFSGVLLTDPILPDSADLTVGLNLVSLYSPEFTYDSADVLEMVNATEGDKLYQWKNGLWQPPYTSESDPAEIFEIDPATAYFIYIE